MAARRGAFFLLIGQTILHYHAIEISVAVWVRLVTLGAHPDLRILIKEESGGGQNSRARAFRWNDLTEVFYQVG